MGAAFLIGLPALILPFVLYKTLRDHRLSRIAFGVSFMLFSALHIHQSNGMTELHFGIFVLLAVLSAFRDWLVIAVAAGTIAVHHLLFAYLQTQHSAVFLAPVQDATFSNVLVHAVYVIVESAALIIITLNSYKEAMVGLAFSETTKELVADAAQINLTIRALFSAPSGAASTTQTTSSVGARAPLAAGLIQNLSNCSSFAKKHRLRIQYRQSDLTVKELERSDAKMPGPDVITTPLLMLSKNQQLIYTEPFAVQR